MAFREYERYDSEDWQELTYTYTDFRGEEHTEHMGWVYLKEEREPKVNCRDCIHWKHYESNNDPNRLGYCERDKKDMREWQGCDYGTKASEE